MTKAHILIEKYPWPPSLNQSYPTNKQGRRFPSHKLKKYKDDCALWNKQNQYFTAEKELLKRTIATEQFFVEVKVVFSMPQSAIWTKQHTIKKLDTDNRLKALLDSLATTLDIDDKYFVIGLATKSHNASENEYYTSIAIDYAPIKSTAEAKRVYL